MFQELVEEKQVQVNRDDRGNVRELLHTNEHFTSHAHTAQLAAAEYLKAYGDLLGIAPRETNNLGLAHESNATDAGSELRFYSEKPNFDMTTVTYEQTHFGLPVWHAGVSIHMKREPFRVVSSQSTRHGDIQVTKPPAAALARLKQIDKATLAKQLGLVEKQGMFDFDTLAIESVRLIVYRYAKANRAFEIEPPEKGRKQEGAFQTQRLTMSLPPVAESIEDGKHYVAAEVNFALAPRGLSIFHWVAIVEAETMSVLYLRSFVDNLHGLVFRDDPMTDNGGPSPSSNTAALNPVRTAQELMDLAPPSGGTQALAGTHVKVVDVEAPGSPVATEPAGTDFNFDSRTDQFAAVNAYYHCNQFFRFVESCGFNLATYFGTATAIPSPVDHRGHMQTTNGMEINAHCVGTSGGAGIARTTFALADLSDTTHPLGIACDYRVVLHELGGHGILYPHVHSANFGFAHSAGDSFAAIMCDPDTHAPDRYVTFPWVNIGRRHDRAVSAGWGWSGNIGLHPFDYSLDPAGYNNEQILSTTLFRFYMSIGGASSDLAMRQFAARYTLYLVLRAVSTMTPANNPSNAAGMATALITADLGDWTTEGQAGGAYGKVIRWAFEKQGLYQPPGTVTPNNNIGAPPPVDVYIEDGRHGEYQYQPNHWSTQAIWNRQHNDGGATHEEPVVGVTNYAYVKIQNRGTQIATNVVVKAYHADPAAGLVYPNDWQPMTTAQLPAANVPPNSSAEVIVGPFLWTPTQIGHECIFMVASATGDPSNVSNMTAGDSIPEWRLVPNDNNIGQRNVFPVAGGSGIKGLHHALEGAKIVIKNPLQVTARMVVKPVLPDFLKRKGWKVGFANAGEGAFSLHAGAAKTVVLKLTTGESFTPEEVRKAKECTIHVEARANGILVGGMSYELDPAMKAPHTRT